MAQMTRLASFGPVSVTAALLVPSRDELDLNITEVIS